jgi:IS1 family transposase
LNLEQLQLDELYGLVSQLKAAEVGKPAAIDRPQRSSYWVWVALDPVSKLWLSLTVGDRTLACAQQLVHQVGQLLAPGCVPLFITDGLVDYELALLTHFGHWVQPQHRQGRRLKLRWMPLPTLNYAQVIKQRRRRRLVQVSRRVIFGSLEQIKVQLAGHGWQINTAFIERLNLSIRQHVPGLGRRVSHLAKSVTSLRQQGLLYQTYYNFCLPHTSLRRPLVQSQPTKGAGSMKKWQPCTPAMAAGVTDKVWSLQEVLLFRVPPWPQTGAA